MNCDEGGINDIVKELQSVKYFWSSVKSKLMKMKEAITCHYKAHRSGDEGDTTLQFVSDLLKHRISTLENELSKKDARINFLSKQLVLSTGNSSNINNASVSIETIASSTNIFILENCAEHIIKYK